MTAEIKCAKIINYYIGLIKLGDLYNKKYELLQKYNNNWKYICKYEKLSEEFIELFIEDIDWKYICVYQKLSVNFIRKYQDKINWKYIFLYQNLSEDIIKIYYEEYFNDY